MLDFHFNDYLSSYKSAFSRESTFFRFEELTLAFSIRTEFLGITDFNRILPINENQYLQNLHFFKSSESFSSKKLIEVHTKNIISRFKNQFSTLSDGRVLLCIDTNKLAKEGKHEPGVKSLHQNSESNSKASYIMGHHFQDLGVIIKQSDGTKAFLPLATLLCEGYIDEDNETKTTILSNGLELCKLVLSIFAKQGIQVVIVGDAYYQKHKFIEELFNKYDTQFITRAQKNAVCFKPIPYKPPKKRKRGRPPALYCGAFRRSKKTTKVKNLNKLKNVDERGLAVVHYSRHDEEVKFVALKMIWRPYKTSFLNYIHIENPDKSILVLVTNDLNLNPQEVISAYKDRSLIETGYKELKENFGRQAYHFWTGAIEKTRIGSKGTELSKYTEDEIKNIQKTDEAYHRYQAMVNISYCLCIYLSEKMPKNLRELANLYQRTVKPGNPAIKVVKAALRASIDSILKGYLSEKKREKFWRSMLTSSFLSGNSPPIYKAS